jgi:hypothetical protein
MDITHARRQAMGKVQCQYRTFVQHGDRYGAAAEHLAIGADFNPKSATSSSDFRRTHGLA